MQAESERMAEVLVIGVAVADFVFGMETLPDRAAKYRAARAEVVGGGCGWPYRVR